MRRIEGRLRASANDRAWDKLAKSVLLAGIVYADGHGRRKEGSLWFKEKLVQKRAEAVGWHGQLLRQHR